MVALHTDASIGAHCDRSHEDVSVKLSRLATSSSPSSPIQTVSVPYKVPESLHPPVAGSHAGRLVARDCYSSRLDRADQVGQYHNCQGFGAFSHMQTLVDRPVLGRGGNHVAVHDHHVPIRAAATDMMDQCDSPTGLHGNGVSFHQPQAVNMLANGVMHHAHTQQEEHDSAVSADISGHPHAVHEQTPQHHHHQQLLVNPMLRVDSLQLMAATFEPENKRPRGDQAPSYEVEPESPVAKRHEKDFQVRRHVLPGCTTYVVFQAVNCLNRL